MKKLKLFFACLLMAVLSIGQVWADTQAVLNSVSTKEVVSTAGQSVSKVFDGVTCQVTKTGGSTSPGFYTSSGIVRYYTNDVMTLSVESGNTISQIDFVMTSGSVGTASEGTLSSNTWTGNAESVSFTGGATVKISSITVTYSSGGSTKTLSSVAVSGTPTKTEYYAGQNFDPAGLTVTGTYSDASQQTFTSGITWAYNPSQTLALNQTSIGVTATVSEITSEEFTVNGLTVTEAPAAVNYEKVVEAPEGGWSGEYLIVYEPNASTARVWTGEEASNCYVEAEITAGIIAQPEGTASVTIAEMTGGYSIQVNGGTNDGKYIQNNGNSNGIKFVDAGVANTLAYENSAVTITCNSKKFRYNSSSGQDRFRYFGSDQQVIQLYKKVDGAVKPSAGLAFETSAYLVKANGSLATPTLSTADGFDGTVTYASSDADVVAVNTTTGALTIKAAGKAEITASSLETENFKAGSAKYIVYVAEQAGTAEDPLTEASAKALIDLGCTLNAHVNGLVLSQNSTNFTVTLTNGFQFYKAKDLNNVAFESAYLGAGDEVTAVGALKKFSSTYELDEGCYLTYYQQAATSLTPIENTKETAYSVATALGYAAEPLVYQLTDPIYIEGVVYKVENFNSTNGTLDIYIKDADADNEFELFRCKGIYDESLTAFTAADDVREGDQVIGYGVLKHFTNSTTDIWEFDNNATGDYLVSLVRPTIPVTGINLTESTASVAVGAKVTLHASVEPSTANNKTIVWSVQSGSDKASVADGVVTGIAEGTAVIRAASDEDASIYKECTVTVSPLSPWATTYTSNITLSTEGGTSASAAKVKFDGEETEYAAIKAGTGSAAGAVVVNVPAQATKLHFHAYSWYSETVELTVSAPAGVTVTPSTAIAIYKNSGIKENSPFTLAEASTPQYDAYFVVSLSGNSEPVALTISATSGKRFVLFGVNQEGGIVLESIAVSGTASVLEYTDGQHFDPTGLTVTGTYTDASTAPITEDIVWAFDPDPLTEGTTSVSVTATAAGFTSDAFVVNGLTVGSAAPLSPWATTWTSNLDDVTGAKVKFYGEETEYAAIKAGSGSAAGTATLNIPAQATELHLHAYGWNSEDVTLSITAPAGVTVTPASITLNRNAGFASSSPFTLAEGSTPQTDAYYALSLSGNTDAIELTITATAGKRFLLFGVNQVGGVVPVLKSISITGEATELEYEDGDEFDPAGLGVNAIYTLNDVDQEPVAVAAKDIEWSFDPANLTTGTTSVTVTATVGDKSANLVVNGLNVVSATPEITTQPANYVNFTVTKDDALPAAKTITVSLKSVASATAVLGGTNPEAFNISKTALVNGDEINVSVVSTATVGAYVATVTISDNAGVAADKVVTINLTVKAPEAEETPVSTSSKWVAATEIADGMQVLITGFKSSKRYAIGAQTDNNRTAVEGSMDGDVFTPGENTMAFTVVAQEGGKYALRASNGKYLYAASSSKNYLRSQDEVDDNAKWTLSVSSATANGTNSNNQLKLNTSSNIFSCYASGQTAITLYVPQVVEKDLIRGELSNGKWGTLCPKQDVENVEGAEFFQIAYLEEKDGKPFNMHFDAISGTTLEAGKPYFFIANATEIRGIKTGAVLEAAGEGENGFHGYIGTSSWELPYVAEYNSAGDNTFVIHGNKVVRINQSGTMLPSERCYILINATVPSRGAVAPAPGRRRISMGVQSEQTATDVDNVQGDNVQCTKVLINGQLFILRGEKMFDATGRLVK